MILVSVALFAEIEIGASDFSFLGLTVLFGNKDSLFLESTCVMVIFQALGHTEIWNGITSEP
uniref:Uncharacterized protein n=1 Tax=Rhizophagus irregularis (strain DAOM 181602 / DAOM 197198 / MUCL 43194) TaxID=747089 RepID=U9SQV5_RHIID